MYITDVFGALQLPADGFRKENTKNIQHFTKKREKIFLLVAYKKVYKWRVTKPNPDYTKRCNS